MCNSISCYQSAATSEMVKLSCYEFISVTWRYSKCSEGLSVITLYIMTLLRTFIFYTQRFPNTYLNRLRFGGFLPTLRAL